MKTKTILKGWALLWALTALGPSTGCVQNTKPGRPVWAVAHQYQKFTPEHFIIGVGSGPRAEVAKQRAKDEIMGGLRKALAGELQLRGTKLSIAGSPALAPSSADSLLESLPETTEVLSWSDKKKLRYYSMVVMKRTELARSTKAQIEEWEMQSMELTGKASASVSQSPYSALMNLMAATLLRAQAEQQRTILAVVDKSPPPAQKGPSLKDLVSRIKDLLGRVRISAAHGKALSLNANTKKLSLVLSADLKTEQSSVPFSGCPVVFESKGLPSIKARIGPAGMATAKLKDLAKHAGQQIVFQSHIDGAMVLQDSGLDMDDARFASLKKMFQSKSASFHLRLTDRSAKKIAIAMAETRGGELRQNSRVVQVLQSELVNKGYNVLPFDELGVKLPADPTPKTMSEAFRGKTGLLIYGVAASSLERKVSQGLVFVKATAHVVLLQVATGKVLAQQTLSTRSPGMDLASASDRAFGSLARKISAALEAKGGMDQ